MKAITISSFHYPLAYHHASLTEVVGVFFEGQIRKNSNFDHRSGKWKIFNFKCGPWDLRYLSWYVFMPNHRL